MKERLFDWFLEYQLKLVFVFSVISIAIKFLYSEIVLPIIFSFLFSLIVILIGSKLFHRETSENRKIG